jgi:hypothetical protein
MEDDVFDTEYDSELPDEHEVTVEDWKEETSKIREHLEDEIVAILEKSETPEEAEAELQPLFEPYLFDEPESNAVQLWAEADNESLYMGVRYGDWLEYQFEDERGIWWSTSDSPPEELDSKEEVHRHVAEEVVETHVYWNPQDRRRIVRRIESYREKVSEYLEQVNEIEQDSDGELSAADLRGPLVQLVQRGTLDVRDEDNTLLERMQDFEIRDESPRADRTELLVGTEEELAGIVVAVPPGEPWQIDEVAEDEDRDVLFTTDHRNFDFTEQILDEDKYRVTLVPYDERKERLGDYTWAARSLSSNLGMVLEVEVEE